MKISIKNKYPLEGTSPVFLLSTLKDFDTHAFTKSLNPKDKSYIKSTLKTLKLEKGESKLVNLPSNPEESVLILGFNPKTWDRNTLLITARKIVSLAKTNKLENIVINLKDFQTKGIENGEVVSLIAQNLLMADFSFDDHKEEPEGGWPKVSSVSIFHPRKSPTLNSALKEGLVIGEATNSCRHLSNTPGGIMTPAKLANAAKRMAEKNNVKVKILDEAEIKKLDMGGVIGVSQGSSEKPRFIILEHGPANKKPIVFVGKGVTFDTGGISLKSAKAALGMHMDMSGAAAVIHAIEAIARLKLPIRVVGLIPAVENMPSGSSYRPGDILKTYIGKTIEVINTDAEGRVIMADALGYAQDYKPRLVVDVATLTGAAVVALGQRTSAIFSNQEGLLDTAKKVGNKSGDRAWPMPAWDEYDEEVKGSFGDVANSGKYYPYGGAITAAVFLKQFVGDYPWMHLDIAPTMETIDGQYLSRGASGAGVRFLVELTREYAKK